MMAPDNIQDLKKGEVFVFGSNLAGRHGKGAAKQAMNWGAIYGLGEGLQGNTYALPTKGHNMEVLSLIEIERHVRKFLETAMKNSELSFLLTEIGCGLAGYLPSDISPMFRDVPSNVHLPKSFLMDHKKRGWIAILPEDTNGNRSNP